MTYMSGLPGASRRTPALWDHQRVPLLALRRCFDEMLDRIASPAAGRRRVLDFGCGDRPYEPLIRSRGFEYIASDLDGNVDVVFQPGTAVPIPDSSLAGILSTQVLEHVWDLDWYLGECRRMLEPEGWLLLSTHGVWLYHPHPTDYRRWTREGLRRELEGRKLQVVAIQGLVGPLAWTTQFRALGIRHGLLRAPLLNRLIPLIMAIMNLRMLVEERITPEAVRQENACIYVALCRPCSL
jgi:SAM-dependent methyltransferase